MTASPIQSAHGDVRPEDVSPLLPPETLPGQGSPAARPPTLAEAANSWLAFHQTIKPQAVQDEHGLLNPFI